MGNGASSPLEPRGTDVSRATPSNRGTATHEETTTPATGGRGSIRRGHSHRVSPHAESERPMRTLGQRPAQTPVILTPAQLETVAGQQIANQGQTGGPANPRLNHQTVVTKQAVKNPLAFHKRTVVLIPDPNPDDSGKHWSLCFDYTALSAAKIYLLLGVSRNNGPRGNTSSDGSLATLFQFRAGKVLSWDAQVSSPGRFVLCEQQADGHGIVESELHDLVTADHGFLWEMVLVMESVSSGNGSVSSEDGIPASIAVALCFHVQQNAEGAFSLNIAHHIMHVNGEEYELQEIYGLEQATKRRGGTTPHANTNANAVVDINGGGDSPLSEQPVRPSGEFGTHVSVDEQHDEDGDCVICLTELRDTVVLPCRHLCVCSECAVRVRETTDQCPVCRQPVYAIMRIHNLRPE